MKFEDTCSQMVHLSASGPLQVLRAICLKLASSYFPAPKIENFSCAKKNSNRCKVKMTFVVNQLILLALALALALAPNEALSPPPWSALEGRLAFAKLPEPLVIDSCRSLEEPEWPTDRPVLVSRPILTGLAPRIDAQCPPGKRHVGRV